MTRGLAEWDERVARVESGLRADVTNVRRPPARTDARTLGTVYLERGRMEAALAQFGAAAVILDPSLAQIHVLSRARPRPREPVADAAAAYRTAWPANPRDGTTAYLVLRAEPQRRRRSPPYRGGHAASGVRGVPRARGFPVATCSTMPRSRFRFRARGVRGTAFELHSPGKVQRGARRAARQCRCSGRAGDRPSAAIGRCQPG